MRLASPLPPKKPLRRPEPAQKPATAFTGSKARSVSWWAPLADPALPREKFSDAARARDVEMRSDATWQRPENFQQLGSKANS